MDQLKKQVHRARGRLNLQKFLGIVTWSLFAWLLVAVVALAVPKIWVTGWDEAALTTYKWSVGGAAIAFGLVTAGIWTYMARLGDLEAAIELDHRFGLRERVSSSLALTPEEADSEAGQALVSDAVRRVERLDVNDRFKVGAGWKALLPLAPAAVLLIVAILVPDAFDQEAAEAEARTVEVKKQIKTSTELLKKKIAERSKQAEEKGLTDAKQIFDKIDKGLDGMHEKTPEDKKQAMVKLNNLAKDLKDRADRLREANDLRKQMDGLNDIKKGPADKLAKSLKDGDFQAAKNELKELQDKLAKGELTEQDKQKMEQQLQQMQDKLNEVAEAHQQAMDQLEQQIQDAKDRGDNAAAGQMQQQLDQLRQQQQAMQQMQNLADKLGQAANQLQQGNPEAAAEQLQELAENLQQMQNMEEELEMLEDALDQIAQAKQQMNCPQCQGGGCQQCQGQNGQLAQGGQGEGDREGEPGNGMGAGQGQGLRPEEEHDTDSFDSQVRANRLGRGAAYDIGTTGGKNIAGQAREQISDTVTEVQEGVANPLTNKRLPRPQRELAKEYFDIFREGK